MLPEKATSSSDSDQSGPGFHVLSSITDIPSHIRRYVTQDDVCKLHFFKHPLYVSMLPLVTPLPLEEFIQVRTDFAEKALLDDGARRYLFLHERAFRSTTFLEMYDDGYWQEALSNPRKAREFWRCAAYVWADCEEDEDAGIWEDILTCDIPHQGFMTKSADRKALKAMGDTITVYRGVQGQTKQDALEDGMLGFQWSLSKDIAKFFSHRFLRKPNRGFVLTATARTSDVLAYLTSRGESEVIIHPECMMQADISIEEVSKHKANAARANRNLLAR